MSAIRVKSPTLRSGTTSTYIAKSHQKCPALSIHFPILFFFFPLQPNKAPKLLATSSLEKPKPRSGRFSPPLSVSCSLWVGDFWACFGCELLLQIAAGFSSPCSSGFS
ncbi:hypothetical protein SLEP1_g48653 [Rubroshorea leprosula]|uniref:Uncharacterized protein n=1 Tax=Rubroshorea leprosula TaxID=152421 RepID=A0AAV5LUC5_9ROSI|nr:hypothetical protein SLEP1_g48653 [Rubroshorea leprosula]